MPLLLLIVALLTVLTTLATTIVTLVKTATQTQAIAQIHVLVNSRLTAVISWADQLANTLEKHGIDVPKPPAEADLEGRDGKSTAERQDQPGQGPGAHRPSGAGDH